MSAVPDPAPPSAPATYGRVARRGVSVWALVAFGVLCLLAGFGLARFGGQWLASKPQAVDAPLAAYDAAPVAASPPAASVVTPLPPPATDLSAVETRLATLEAAQARTAQAASAALAAAALVEASQSSRPFVDELAALDDLAPASTQLASLRRLAEIGAPSRAALAATFPDAAARAAAAARAPGDNAGLLARVAAALSRVVTLRQVGDVPGKGVDAVLARAERQVEDGDLAQALRTLDDLPPSAREAMAGWRARAERRAEVDRRVAAVRGEALADLVKLARPAP